MTIKQQKEIRLISIQLIARLRKKYKSPYTLLITAWQDEDFSITLSSTNFLNGGQKDELRKPECKAEKIQIYWHRGKFKKTVTQLTIKSEYKLLKN